MAKKEAAANNSANLIKEIPEEKQKEIAVEICENYDTDIQSRSVWEEKRDKWYKLWAGIRGEKTDPWPGCSNVAVPLLATASNQFHGRAYQSIFAAPGLIKCIPVSSNDVERAERVEKYLNWQTLYEMEDYEDGFDKLLQLLPINGTGFRKFLWDKNEVTGIGETIGALDIVLPYRTKALKAARRLVHRLWLYYDELQIRNEQKLYENFDKVRTSPGQKEEGALKQTADEATGETRPPGDEKPHLILERHSDWDLGDGRKPYIFTVDYDSMTLLRVASRQFKGKTIDYFIDYHFIPNPEGFYSFGFGHFLETLNEMADTVFNQIFDAGSLSNMPFGFYGRRAGLKKRQVKLKPGLFMEVEDASNIHFPSLQRVDMVLFQVLGLIRQFTEQFTSTSDYLMGRESQGTKTPTAHGTLAIIEQGLVTFAVLTKRVFRALRKELKLLMALDQLHLPETKQYRVMGSEEEIAFPKIKRVDFDSVADIIPIGDPSYASKMLKTQEAMQRYEIMMQNPLVVGNPNTGDQPNKRAIWQVTSDLLDALGTPNKSKILPPLPPEPIPPEAENAMFMQGDYKSPIPGETHAEHWRVHTTFQETEFYHNMPPEYQELVDRHLLETQQVAYTEAAQLQQLGSGGALPTGEGMY